MERFNKYKEIREGKFFETLEKLHTWIHDKSKNKWRKIFIILTFSPFVFSISGIAFCYYWIQEIWNSKSPR